MSGIIQLPPGIHFGVSEDIYHSDPAEQISLSSGIARLLISRSPKHAHAAHPRLGGSNDDTPGSEAMVNGTILHKLVLGAGRDLAILNFDDYRAKAAKEARDEAVMHGRTPILAHKLAPLQDAAAAITREIQDHPDLAQMTEPGEPEATLIWHEPKFGITCRARVDWLPSNPRAWLYDLKTTGMSAAPEEWQRKLISDYCFQAVFYERGARALGRQPPGMRFVVAEVSAPYGISVMTPAPSLLAYAERELEAGMALWAKCLRDNEWPGYPRATAYVEAPTWLLMRQEERALNRDIMENAA